ncbi:helix-turn-helix transcriptional regulator [Mycobacterium sp. MS1601]|uniref:isoniazid response ATPase/transcriptional regulator IniR n=1 Tax=Mycobacterium sp. MS1601 TaxID=1936029 RepID=UPI00097938A1|nr:isoniazid response ATPase/transcriptional regulator IniR [Mycobacterium sp. MS1601]AQA03698.1 helix-turn-helix transcriptional regulator [Mycobacterium sp. MS1601]
MNPVGPADIRRWSPLLATIRDHPDTPVKALITGGIGTGKSSALAEIRDTLRGNGIDVRSRPAEDSGAAALVIDDAHLLSGVELAAVTTAVADPRRTVVVATEARENNAGLRELMAALERERPRLVLGSLTQAEIAAHLPGSTPAAVAEIASATAGLPFLLPAVGADGVAGDGAVNTLTERLRRTDQSVLHALLIASLSPDLGPTDIAAALDISSDDAHSGAAAAHATGLLDPSHGDHFRSSVHDATARIVGTARHHDVEVALLRSQLEMGTLSTSLALRLAEHGVRDARLTRVLGDEAARVRARPEVVARLLRAAAAAGADAPTVPLADALALTGDCAAAAALADELLTSPDPGQRTAAVRVAAAVAAHDGDMAHAAELFGWIGPQDDAVLSAAAVVALVGAGNPAGAREALGTPIGPPTAAARAARSLADGLLLTVDQSYSAAVIRLGQALGPEKASTEALPDTPAALVSLAALHAGDAVRARSVLGRAVRTAEPAMFSQRHRLLAAWVKMQDGHLPSAAADAAAVPTVGLHRRDALWAAALRTGLARRNGDAGALQTQWSAAMDVLTEFSVDLYSLLPLGELWVAAARLRQGDRLSPVLEQAFSVLGALGDPIAWSLPLHWAGVHAAILANSPESLAPHGQALTAAGAHSDFARALAVAGRSWLRVLARQVDVDDVTAAARGLAQFGLTWDATRLAGQAALQAGDPRVSGAMLQVARDLKLTSGTPEPPEENGASTPVPKVESTPATSPLSDREREVAELLVLGMPYRDIGAQLFISAKTVEHHVARIRRRLGAESRSEMLSMLRALLTPSQ